MRKVFTLLLGAFLILPIFSTIVSAADVKTEMSKSNDFIEKSKEAIKADDLSKGKDLPIDTKVLTDSIDQLDKVLEQIQNLK